MVRLPVSGAQVRFRAVTGVQEIALLAARGDTSAAAIARLLDSLCEADAVGEWLSLPVSDADAALLAGHQTWVGDRIETTVRCPYDDCGEKADVDFSVSDFLEYRRPVLPPGTARSDGYFVYDGVSFRAPTLGDEQAARASASPVDTLRERCIETKSPHAIRKIERMLEKIAPNLFSELSIGCPACGRNHTAGFDPRAFVLKELGDQAQFLWDDVHLIASSYHWSKDEILTIDRATRAQLAERIRSERRAVE